jgi:hypothetical protein
VSSQPPSDDYGSPTAEGDFGSDPLRKRDPAAPGEGQPAAPEESVDPYRFGPPSPNPYGYPSGPPAAAESAYTPPPQAYPGSQGYPAAPPPAYPGAPPQAYPGAYPYQAPRQGNGKATAGLVLGILAIVLFWIPFGDVALDVLAIVFGALGLREAKRGAGGRGKALAGLICGIIGAIGSVIIFAYAIHEVKSCSDKYPIGTIGYENCIHNR